MHEFGGKLGCLNAALGCVAEPNWAARPRLGPLLLLLCC